MAGALRRYAENQFAAVVGDLARKVYAYRTTVTPEDWDKEGDGGKAECATWGRYLALHPGARREEFDALKEKLETDTVAAATLAQCADYEEWKRRWEERFRTTLEQMKATLVDVRAKMAAEPALDGATRAAWDEDYAEVIARVDVNLAEVPKAAQTGLGEGR